MERLFLLAGLLLGLAHLAHSTDFVVGGDQGWVVRPEPSYEEWSKEQDFRRLDNLIFKSNGRKSTVVQVTEQDFKDCDAKDFISRYPNKNTVTVTLDQVGPAFFISGRREFCNQGQKIKVMVAEAEAPSDSPISSSTSHHSPSSSPSIAPSPEPTSSASMVAVSRVFYGVLVLLVGLLWRA